MIKFYHMQIARRSIYGFGNVNGNGNVNTAELA